MKRCSLLLGVALAALVRPALADDLTLTGQIGVPITTSSASNGSAGNITINQGARAIIGQPGAVITIDSNNSVTSSGVIQNTQNGGAIGVQLNAGNSGNLTINGANGAIVCLSTDCINFGGSGVGNTGVLVTGAGTFTGNIDLQFGSTMVVIGPQSTGVLIDSKLTGNLSVTQTMTVSGEGAAGILVRAPIEGEFTVGGALTARGINIYTPTNVDPLSNSLVAIGSNVTNGFVVLGSGSSTDLTRNGTLLNSGTAPTVIIAPSVAGSGAANIVIGPRTSDAFGKQTYSFINRGLINASENDPGISTTAVQIGELGAATHTVNLSGGLYNRDRIIATAQSNNDFATLASAAPTDAYGLIVGNGATVGKFTVTGAAGSGSTISSIVFDASASSTDDFYKDLLVTLNGGETRVITSYDGDTKTATVGSLNGSSETWPAAPAEGDSFQIMRNVAMLNDGQIQATVTGNQSGKAVAMKILEQGNLSSLINTGTISALITSTDAGVANLTAYAIQDLSGTLTTIVNTGRIAAAATTLDNGTQKIVAVDLSHGTGNQTFQNNGIVVGDVLFGSGSNQLTISGSAAAVVNGAVLKGNGTLGIQVSADGTGGILQTSNTRATTLAVGTNGEVKFTIDKNTTTAPLIATTGATSFAASTGMAVTPTTFLPTSQVYTLVSTDASGALHMTEPSATTAIAVPYMYKGTVTCDNAACGVDAGDFQNLKLTLVRKTASELGLTGNSARIYNALGDAVLGDDAYGAALLGLTNAGQVQTSIESVVPDIAGGMRALSVAMTDQATGVVAARQRNLMTAPAGAREDLHFWTQEFYNNVNEDRSSTGTGYNGAGQGIALGAEWGSLSTGRYGVGYTFFSSQETERHPRDTKTNGDWNMLSAYAAWKFGDVFVSPQVNAGRGDFASRRTVVATSDPSNITAGNSLLRSATAQYSGYLASGGVSTGYIIDFGMFQIIPEVSFDGLYMRQSAYREVGAGGMNLSLKSQDQKSARAFAGVLGQGAINYEGGNFMPQFIAGWSHEFLDSPATIDGTFESAPGSPFHLVGPQSPTNRMVGGMSFAYVMRNWSAGFNYDAAASSGSLAQSATFSLSSRF